MAKEDPLDVLRRARIDAIEISDKASGRALYRLLKDAEDDLAYRITRHKRLRPLGDGTYTREQMEVTIRQIRDVMASLVRRMGPMIAGASVDAAGSAAEGVVEYLGAAEAKYSGIVSGLAFDEAAMSDAAIAGTRASVLRRLMVEHPDGRGGGILQRYGFEVTRRFERELSVAVVSKKPFDEVREALVEQSPFLQGAPRSWAERLTRTELHGAYNRGAHEAMKRAEEDVGPMLRILVATFDGRTGPDSVNVHGEVRRMGEPFEYVAYDGEREHFMIPPNRPNDREVVVAHLARWPIPAGFRPKSDGEVETAYRRAGQKYRGRPRVMSTVRGIGK
jgi:hypothetical protein